MRIVRDNIPGCSATPDSYRKPEEDTEFHGLLLTELIRAAVEVADTFTEPNLIDKLADILEAVEVIGVEQGLDFSRIRGAQVAKRHEHGSYSERWICTASGV